MKNSLTTQIWQVLTPSWLSGFVAGFVSLGAVAGTIIVTNYEVSNLRQQIFTVNNSGNPVPNFDYQAITANLANNRIIDNLPLFLFWAALGVIVYLFATGTWSGFANAETLREELEYVNAPRQWIIRTMVVHLAVRCLVLLVWLGYLRLSLAVLVPYVLAAAHVAATNPSLLSGLGYGLLATVVGAVAIQAHVVLLRLLLLKVRVFGGAAV